MGDVCLEVYAKACMRRHSNGTPRRSAGTHNKTTLGIAFRPLLMEAPSQLKLKTAKAAWLGNSRGSPAPNSARHGKVKKGSTS